MGAVTAEQMRLNNFYDQQVGSALRKQYPAHLDFGTQLSASPYYVPDYSPGEFSGRSRYSGQQGGGEDPGKVPADREDRIIWDD